MEKRSIVIFVALFIAMFALHDCKPEKPAQPAKGDADSTYVGTPYSLQLPAFGFPKVTPPSDNPMTVQGVQLGRMLFYDPVLSSDSMFSCSSCHKQQFAFADGGKVLSTNIFGLTKRNTPALFNLLWEPSLFWDGRSATMPAQATDAMMNEMNFSAAITIPKLQANATYVALFKKAFGKPGTITEDNIHKALEQFEMTLISSESKFDSVVRGQMTFTQSELNGFNLFLADTLPHGGDCFHCHASNSAITNYVMEDGLFHNNAIDSSLTFTGFPDLGQGAIDGNQLDNGKFKTPHFRNLEVTGPYMRDGRFATLEQVINFYNDSLHQSPTVDPFMKTAYRGGLHYLTEQNKQDIIAFIKTMTDHRFLTNPDFTNPFVH